jgi:fibro-slime domain-containing protein
MRAEHRLRSLAALVGVSALLLAACAPEAGRPGDDGDGGAPRADGNGDPNAGFIDAALLPDGTSTGNVDCASLPATVRDFHRTHPDFEAYTTNYVATGIVQPLLDADHKPVYAPAGATACTSGPAAFADWYHDVLGINQPLPVTIHLVESSPGSGRYVYDSDAFFPIDGQGFGNEGFNHNFHFTTEIHTSFKYQGGESFTFRGDDDLWLFVNSRLAIDLGGLHEPVMQTVNLDQRASELGLVRGQTYAMDIFHAERHTVASTFHIETTIDCFVVP